jgi:hypothetical protein
MTKSSRTRRAKRLHKKEYGNRPPVPRQRCPVCGAIWSLGFMCGPTGCAKCLTRERKATERKGNDAGADR